MTRDESKQLYEDYRNKAKQLAAEGTDDELQLSVVQYANVQLCEDGAFVECQVWIPKGLLTPPKKMNP